MRVAIDAVCETGKLAEGAICYTGDILDPDRAKYSLDYYVGVAKELERAGCHILAIKDMAGLLRPSGARVLVKALREACGLPLHLHTHDTSGISAATVLAAAEAGVDAADAAIDTMSGTTSQPCLGSIVKALRHSDRDTGLDSAVIRQLSSYWEAARLPICGLRERPQDGHRARFICTKCRAASSPISRSRRARSASINAGTKSPRPIARRTIFSATSSR